MTGKQSAGNKVRSKKGTGEVRTLQREHYGNRSEEL